MTTKAICVWLDKIGDPGNPGWIVSLDELDEHGRAISSHTIDVLDADDRFWKTSKIVGGLGLTGCHYML